MATKKPISGKPVAKKPADKKPISGKPVARKPAGKKPISGKPVNSGTATPAQRKMMAKKMVAKAKKARGSK